jgi:hypothetical protein
VFNPTKAQVLEAIQLRAEGNYDVVVDCEQVQPVIEDTGRLGFNFPNQLSLRYSRPSGSAELQYLSRIKVPGQFFHTCSPSLKGHILEEKHKDRRFKFRMRRQIIKSGVTQTLDFGPDHIRAILGPQFPTDRDDLHLFPVALDALDQPNIQLMRFLMEEHTSELLVHFSDTSTSLDTHNVKGAISISNSETGHSSLWIEPVIQIFDGIWLGNRYGDGQSTGARWVHRGAPPTVEELREDIENAKRVAQVGIIQYLEAVNTRVTGGEAVKYLENLEVLPKRFSTIITNELKDEQFVLKSELLRRILLAANNLPLIQSLQVRRQVGSYMGIFQNTASRMASLANEVNQG